MSIDPGDLIAAASILVGFGLTALMFRIQRELWVQDHKPDWPTWVACADCLAIGAMVLGLFVIVVLLAVPALPEWLFNLSAGSCAADAVTLGGLLSSHPLGTTESLSEYLELVVDGNANL